MAICIPPVLNFINPEVLGPLFFIGRAFNGGPLAPRNILYSGFCGDPQEAQVSQLPSLSGTLGDPVASTIQTDFTNVLDAIWRSELQDYLDARRLIYERATDRGIIRGGVVPYLEQHEWRGRIWKILSSLYQAYRQWANEAGDYQSFYWEIQAENWRRKQLNNDVARTNRETLYQRQLEAREMIGNLLTQCAIFAQAPEE